MESSGIVIAVLVWVFFYTVITRMAKNKKQAKPSDKAVPPPPPADHAPAPAVQAAQATQARTVKDEMEAAARPGPGGAAGYQPIRPSLFSGSAPGPGALAGSLNAVSLEGVDPCHDEQAEETFRRNAEESRDAATAAGEGLALSWTGTDLVRGFVYSEVLRRRVPNGRRLP